MKRVVSNCVQNMLIVIRAMKKWLPSVRYYTSSLSCTLLSVVSVGECLNTICIQISNRQKEVFG